MEDLGGSGTVDGSIDEDLRRLLASDPDAMADAVGIWRHLREEHPVYRQGPVVLVTGYEDVKAIIRDARRFSSAGRSTGSRADALRSKLDGDAASAWDQVTAFENLYVSRSDDPEHDRRRQVAQRTFTPRRIAELRDATGRYAEQLLDRLSGEPEVDLMDGLAYRLPLMVICDMLGVPDEDRELIHGWSSTLARSRGGDDAEVVLAAHEAMQQFRAYVLELAKALRHRRDTGLLAALMGAEDEGLLTTDELVAMFVVLLFAGHETTTNLIGTGQLALLREPDQWRRILEQPHIVPNAVEELLRHVSPTQWAIRLTVEPVAVGGVDLEPGQAVFAVLAAANRDPRAFAEPDLLDVGRDTARQHLALGFGPHFCLGNALARLEGQVVLSVLARRFPDVELATDELRWRGNAMLRGLAELPVRLGPDRR